MIAGPERQWVRRDTGLLIHNADGIGFSDGKVENFFPPVRISPVVGIMV